MIVVLMGSCASWLPCCVVKSNRENRRQTSKKKRQSPRYNNINMIDLIRNQIQGGRVLFLGRVYFHQGETMSRIGPGTDSRNPERRVSAVIVARSSWPSSTHFPKTARHYTTSENMTCAQKPVRLETATILSEMSEYGIIICTPKGVWSVVRSQWAMSAVFQAYQMALCFIGNVETRYSSKIERNPCISQS